MPSGISKWLLIVCIWFIWSGSAGCARTVYIPSPAPAPPPPPPPKTVIIPPPQPPPTPSPPPKAEKPAVPSEPPAPEERPNPRAVASLGLTEQGRMLLESKKPDDAIEILERAMSLNPTNGENYYYLAEAWLQKGNVKQAEEYNHLAGMYLERDQKWVARLEAQAKKIRGRRR